MTTLTHHLLVLKRDTELLVRVLEVLQVESAGQNEALVPLLALVFRLVRISLRSLDGSLFAWAFEGAIGKGDIGRSREHQRRTKRLTVRAVMHPAKVSNWLGVFSELSPSLFSLVEDTQADGADAVRYVLVVDLTI